MTETMMPFTGQRNGFASYSMNRDQTLRLDKRFAPNRQIGTIPCNAIPGEIV